MTRGAPFEKPINGSPARPVVRFAPSPNGRLHLGHAYSALFCCEVARALGARFLLRIEDIDQTRARGEFVEAIFDDLTWLGLTWETPVRRQSEHLADYKQALEQLSKAGLLYASTTTRAEIQVLTKQLTAGGTAPARDPGGSPILARKVLENVDATPGQPKAMRL
ncbi:MAG: glutamate--tRNA ligase family protein, partial [Hyphomicrobiales bacterium]